MRGNELKLLSLNFKLLEYAGITPSRELFTNVWKRCIYIIYVIIQYFFCIPSLLLEVLSYFKYEKNTEVYVDCTNILMALLICYFNAVYFKKNWKNFRDLINKLELESMFTSNLVQSKQKYRKIIDETKRSTIYLTWFLTLAFNMSSIPLILMSLPRYISNFDPNKFEPMDEMLKYFPYVMWLPSELEFMNFYFQIYIFQIIALCVFTGYASATISLLLSLIIYSAAQFKLVSAIISDVDEVTSAKESKQLNDDGEKIQLGANTFKNFIKRSNNTVVSSNLTFMDDLTYGNSKSYLENHTFLRRTSVEDKDSCQYLKECVKLHDSAIKFSKHVNAVTSTNFFAIVVIATILIIGNVFILSLATSLKFSIACLTFVTTLFVLCLFGETVITQSLAVGDAAYNCAWYERSVKFKRMLLMVMMRAQKPSYIKAGSIWIMSIHLYNQAINTAYSSFTVLKKLNEP